jgi:hypothetical protein
LLKQRIKKMWTKFTDMHSGGPAKVRGAENIYIEARQRVAIEVFERVFSRDPNNVTCYCCGEDYSISEHDTLAQATAYARGCAYDHATKSYVESPATWREYKALDQYLADPNVIVVFSDPKE